MQQFQNEPFTRHAVRLDSSQKTRYILVNKKKTKCYTGANNLMICKFDHQCNELPIHDYIKCSAREYLVALTKMQRIVELLNQSAKGVLGLKNVHLSQLDSIIQRLENERTRSV